MLTGDRPARGLNTRHGSRRPSRRVEQFNQVGQNAIERSGQFFVVASSQQDPGRVPMGNSLSYSSSAPANSSLEGIRTRTTKCLAVSLLSALPRSQRLVALRQTFVHGCRSSCHAVGATGSATTLSSGDAKSRSKSVTIQLTTRAYEPSRRRR